MVQQTEYFPNPYPEKTARWWFWQYLPEPIKSQAIDNADERKKNKVYPYLCEAIDSFSWFEPENPQGFDYWDAVFHDASRGNFSTPSPPSPTAEQKKAANFIQWKGTDICMDLHCECGHHNHYDGHYAYAVQCANCQQIYKLAETVEMVKVDKWDNPLQSNEH